MAQFDLVGALDQPISQFNAVPNDADPDSEVAFAVNKGTQEIYCFDVSDPTAPVLLDTLDISSTDAEPFNVILDTQNKFAIVAGADTSTTPDTGYVVLVDYSTPSNLQRSDLLGGREAFIRISHQVWVSEDLVYINETSSGGNGGIEAYSYQSGTISFEGSISFSSPPTGVPLLDTENGLLVALVNTSPVTLELYEVSGSNPAPSSPSDTLETVAGGEGVFDPARKVFFVANHTTNDVRAYKWDGSTIAQVDALALDGDAFTAELSGDRNTLFVVARTSDHLWEIDVSDEAAMSVVNSSQGWPNSSRTLGDIRGGRLYKSESRMVVFDAGNDYVGIFDTEHSFVANAPPDKPTCSVDSADQREADLSSSAFSDPDGDPHDSSRWQVRDQGDADWSTPEYDSGWTATDLTTHTTDRVLTPGADYEARVAHRDPAGAFTWSDPVAFTTETLDLVEAIGPEGFFFGGAGRNDLLKFGQVHEDAGSPIVGRALHRAVAPQGAAAEALFVAVRVTITYETEFEVTFTPVLDGEEITAEAVTTTRNAPSEQTTETFEIPFNRSASGGSRQGLRGTWIRTLLQVTETVGHAGYVSIDGIEYEWEPVRESLPELTFHQENLSPASPDSVTPFYFGVGNSLGRFGGSRNDLGNAVSARAESNLLAPAGATGECIFTNLYLAITRANPSDVPLDVTAIVDETEYAIDTLTLTGVADPVLETIEVPLTKAYIRDTVEIARNHLRGTWFGLFIETSGLLPDGDLIFEGAEVAYEVVQESAGAVSG